jgi:hypothetical protein
VTLTPFPALSPSPSRIESNPYDAVTNLPRTPQFALGLITIGPWAFLVFLDATIWLYLMILWELPWIGGRARGRQRPRAPSLNERPGGQRRAFGLRGVETDTGDSEVDLNDGSDGRAKDLIDTREENISQDSSPRLGGDGILKQTHPGHI